MPADLNRIIFLTIKLPFIYLLIIVGFIFDFLLHLPFLILCAVSKLSHPRS
jgi:hypothetical protein